MSYTIIESLRQQIDSKHAEAIRALETIRGYLESAAPSNVALETAHERRQIDTTTPVSEPSNVDRVYAAISSSFKTVEQLVRELNLPDSAIRSVLYSKAGQKRTIRNRVVKSVGFRLKSEVQASLPLLANKDDVNIAGMVREALSQSKSGMTSKEIVSALGERVTGKTAAVSAALYNMRITGKVVWDKTAGTYTLS